ncbi:PHD finger protein At1g33420-like isoform X2 [Cicer arietinum]|uniref:PHD finger protein At1g33420-like n=1 Tax=Cicer arietinum TaxID=3827 RepID=A0A1S2Z027_CICAR|nr:PHD finger protein At1g33420-like [Cicer arietinum]
MNVTGEKLLNRPKRKPTFDFHTFPPPSEVNFSGEPFRTNVRSFLTKHALLPPQSALFPHLLTWQIMFRIGGDDSNAVVEDGLEPVVCLDVVEEDVARSRSVYCDQCRVVGWSGHPVCGKRYHFIIKADGSSIGGYHKPCMCCGDILRLSESKCKSCNHVISTDDVEDWVYQQLESTTHLLHGVVHANGYGHLLRVNGREGGSRFLSGSLIMDFWDRLCKTLAVRKVSVMDVSKKYGLEYRLIHALMRGHPWYGEWGYQFGSGSYGLTQEAYKTAVESLSNLPLSVFLSEGWKPHSCVQGIISFYQSLSEHQLVNIRDLFRLLMSLLHDSIKTSSKAESITCKKRSFDAMGVSCSWGQSDVVRVEEAMLRVLRAVSRSNWVSSRALKGSVYKVASSELLDYCLGELGGKVVLGSMIVNTRHNPETGALEYRLEAANNSCDGKTSNNYSLGSKRPSKESLLYDLKYLYGYLLNSPMMQNCVPEGIQIPVMSSAQKLLNCKQLVKDYRPEMLPMKDFYKIRFSCHVELIDESENPTIPAELVVLPINATISDLKNEAVNAFEDVYLMFRRFVVDGLLGYNDVDDSTQIKLLLGSAEVVCIRGRCISKNGLSKFKMERGLERWTVDCSCGAKDDDGERMLACDKCGVWQHTICSNIHDSQPVPTHFTCPKCRNPNLKPKSIGNCKDETLANISGSSSCFGKGLPVPSDVH